MRIASDLAGFSLGEADLLRKAMGKKQKDVMAQQRKQFIEGARARNLVAFARRHEDRWLLAVVPRWLTGLVGAGQPPVGDGPWAETWLPLGDEAPSRWRDAFTGAERRHGAVRRSLSPRRSITCASVSPSSVARSASVASTCCPERHSTPRRTRPLPATG